MAIRLHELHPTLAHFPIVLVPAAFVADFFGRLTNNAALMKLGKRLMPIAAASGVATAAAGLVAQEAVEVGDAHDLLVTHRNLNVGLVMLTGVLAMARVGKRQPSTAYLLLSAGGLAGMAYTAYLGGKMVYQHGVGVAPAGGTRGQATPEIRYGHLDEARRIAAHNATQAVKHAIHHAREGDIAPTLRSR